MTRSWWLRISVLVFILAVLAILAGGVLPAGAHSFFSDSCCSGKDCGPAPLGSVKWTPDGWRVSTPRINDTVPFDDQRIRYVPPDEPQRFYICEWPAHRLRCLYAPESGG